jgi:hypothetical protein
MWVTWSAAVMGLATVISMGTVLPLSTMGDIAKRTRPGITAAPFANLRMAAVISSVVA